MDNRIEKYIAVMKESAAKKKQELIEEIKKKDEILQKARITENNQKTTS